MKRYIVMHDYGREGWRVVGEAETILQAVDLREAHLADGGGGDVRVFEHLPALEAYRRAAFEAEQRSP